jgi:hypothetical protein
LLHFSDFSGNALLSASVQAQGREEGGRTKAAHMKTGSALRVGQLRRHIAPLRWGAEALRGRSRRGSGPIEHTHDVLTSKGGIRLDNAETAGSPITAETAESPVKATKTGTSPSSVPGASSRACRGILALPLRLEWWETLSELFLSVNNVPHYVGTRTQGVVDAVEELRWAWRQNGIWLGRMVVR